MKIGEGKAFWIRPQGGGGRKVMDFGRRRESINGNGYGYNTGNSNGNGHGNGNGSGNGFIYDRFGFEERECGDGPITADCFKVSSSSTNSSPSSSSSSPSRYIEHHVTKLDTLAGVAIRYGVEVPNIPFIIFYDFL